MQQRMWKRLNQVEIKLSFANIQYPIITQEPNENYEDLEAKLERWKAGEKGVFRYVNGKKLVLTPAAKLTDELRHQVRNNKPALMGNLIELQRFPEWNWSKFEVSPARFKSFVELISISEKPPDD